MVTTLAKEKARKLWLRAQALDVRNPFGQGPQATPKAVEHLGYVQIDTIHVIERSHHHILYSRIPNYKKADLTQAQSQDKTVFEYWTHALSFVPTKDYRYFMPEMKRVRLSPGPYFQSVKKEEMQKVLRLIKKEGALSIRDIADDILVEKTHAWGSRKPSKKALQWGFHRGDLAIGERQGMLKKYELAERHFSWQEKPKAASENEILDYMIDRALRAQAVVSLDSICYLEASRKAPVLKHLESRVERKELLPVQIEGLEKNQFWIEPAQLELKMKPSQDLVHILSPFDPLVIQRKRLNAFFDYEHRFEAYLPKEKRVFGYFTLPVLIGDQVVAVLDLKTDREKQKLLMQQWTWVGRNKSLEHKKKIEEELHRFEKFQLS